MADFPEPEGEEHPPPGEFMDPRNVGLLDAVKAGWFGKTGELLEGFRVGPDDTVADIGCGDGGNVGYCARHGAQVIFTDVREDKIRALEARLTAQGFRVEGLVSDSAPLPMEDGTATRVICTEVLEHVDEPAAVMAELFRIGQPGSLYLLSVPDPAGEELLATVAPTHYFESPNHVRIFSREGFTALVETSGLEILSRTRYGFFWTFNLAALWASQRRRPGGGDVQESLIDGPFPEFSQRWSRLWWELLNVPDFEPVRAALDGLAPKSQVIIARKPA